MRTVHEIICPHCNTAFTIDEAGYADIATQVRDREFDKALSDQMALAEREKVAAIALMETQVTSRLTDEAAKLAIEIERLKEELKASDEATKAAVDLAALKAAAADPGFVPRALDILATMEATTRETTIRTHNLIGKLEGRKLLVSV